ncbi:MAG: hypothetical protein ABH827_03665 [bacterium]
MRVKLVYILFFMVLGYVQTICCVGLQKVNYFEIVQNKISFVNVDHNQCDICLKKSIILIGPLLFSVRDTGKALYNFFPGVHDFSFFKKVKISPDGKYFGFLTNSIKPSFYLWKVDDDSGFTQFTKMFIPIGCQGGKIVKSFCFSDSEELFLIVSSCVLVGQAAQALASFGDVILSPDFVIESFNDLFILAKDLLPPVEEKVQYHLYYKKLKNGDCFSFSLFTCHDFVDIDFFKRTQYGVKLLGKRVNGDVFLFDFLNDKVLIKLSRISGLAHKNVNIFVGNQFQLMYDNYTFSLRGEGNDFPLFAYEVPFDWRLICVEYEPDGLGQDGRACQTGRFALIYFCDSKIFYFEVLTNLAIAGDFRLNVTV